MMKKNRKRLGDLLVDSKLLTEEQLQSALSEKSESQKLGDVLLQRGYVTEQQLMEVLEFQLGIPKVNLFQYPVDKKLANIVSKEDARRSQLIPLKIVGDKLFVVMADPLDFYATEDLRLRQASTSKPSLHRKQRLSVLSIKCMTLMMEFKTS